MQTLRIYPSSINDRFIDMAVESLRQGETIIYPTDTLYAMACDALNQQAIERLCKAKGINPLKNSLSIVCSDISQASRYTRIDNKAYNLMRSHTPGPFTLLLPAAQSLPKAFKGRRIVGVRIPDNDISRILAERLGNPILTTSLPVDGLDDNEISLPDEIMLRYENSPIRIMIDGGPGLTVPSTIVDITDSSSPVIIRQGQGEFKP